MWRIRGMCIGRAQPRVGLSDASTIKAPPPKDPVACEVSIAMGCVRQRKTPHLSFLYKEILAKMLTALIKGAERREQYNNRAIDCGEMKTPGLDEGK